MRCMGSITSNDTFHSIAWGSKGISDDIYPCGLIAGGMSNGSVYLWDVASIVRYKGRSNANPLVCNVKGHRDNVVGLDFHPQQVNLLASCSNDGAVLVWDLKNPQQPTFQPPSQQMNPNSPPTTCLQWNKKVPQILAHGNVHGETTIWDLRKSKAIITIRNNQNSNHPIRATSLAWNPNDGVQLGVSYNTPIAEIWDLRKMRSGVPISKLSGGHSGSILSLAWNSYDSNVLLSTGDDGRLFCWDANQGQVCYEYPQQGNINYEMHWSPNIPSILSTCSYEGRVTLQSIQNAGKHCPKWLKKPGGSSFGFGGAVVSFGNPTDTKTGNEKGTTKVNLHKFVSEPKLYDLSKELHTIVSQNQYIQLCEKKLSSINDPDDAYVWKYLSILFKDKNEQKALILKELGYNSPPPLKNITNDVSNDNINNNNPNNVPVMNPPPLTNAPSNKSQDFNDVDFFNQDFDLDNDVDDSPKENQEVNNDIDAKGLANNLVEADNYIDSNENDSIEKALIVSDLKKAIDLCIENNRMADALVIASFAKEHDEQLWLDTRKIYFKKNQHKFIRKTFSLVVETDFNQLVNDANRKTWKKILAILLSYAKKDEMISLINRLGVKLHRLHNEINGAAICYLCSGNLDAITNIWTKRSFADKSNPALNLYFAVEKIATFAAAKAANGEALDSENAFNQYVNYSSLLASQGNLTGALEFLELATKNSNINDENAKMLLNRIRTAQNQQAPIVSTSASFNNNNNNNNNQAKQRYGFQRKPMNNNNHRPNVSMPNRNNPNLNYNNNNNRAMPNNNTFQSNARNIQPNSMPPRNNIPQGLPSAQQGVPPNRFSRPVSSRSNSMSTSQSTGINHNGMNIQQQNTVSAQNPQATPFINTLSQFADRLATLDLRPNERKRVLEAKQKFNALNVAINNMSTSAKTVLQNICNNIQSNQLKEADAQFKIFTRQHLQGNRDWFGALRQLMVLSKKYKL